MIYGSRYMNRGRHEGQSLAAYLGGRSLSLIGYLCTGTWLTDTVTALKLFPRELLPSLNLQTSGFELDHEITAKVLARGLQIVEVPVSYHPRTREEGQENRAARLVHRRAHLLPLPQRLTTDQGWRTR